MSPAIYPAAILKESSNLFPFAPYMPASNSRAIGPTCIFLYGLIKLLMLEEEFQLRGVQHFILHLCQPSCDYAFLYSYYFRSYLINITMITSHIIWIRYIWIRKFPIHDLFEIWEIRSLPKMVFYYFSSSFMLLPTRTDMGTTFQQRDCKIAAAIYFLYYLLINIFITFILFCIGW